MAALFAGCSNPSDTPGGPCWDGSGGDPEGSLEIGTGVGAFEPVTPGQLLPVDEGFQGNHHVVVNVKITGLEPGSPDDPLARRPRTRIVVLDSSGAEIDAIPCPYSLAYTDKGSGLELPTGRLVVLQDEVIPAIDREPLTITVDVIDNKGAKASASIDVVADLVSDDLPDAGPDGG